MDPIFHPDERNWISDAVNVGETMSRVTERAKIFFADIEKVKKENPELFKPKEVPRPTQEELAEILKPYDHIYEKPKKSKRKKKANPDDDEVVEVGQEPEIVVEDKDVIEDDSDLSDSDIKLKLVSPDNDVSDDGEESGTKILLDSDEGEDFFASFDQFKSSLYTNYVRDLKKKRSKKSAKNATGVENLDDGSSEDSSDDDYEDEEEESEETSEESDNDEETTESDESEKNEEEIKIDDKIKNDKRKAVDAVIAKIEMINFGAKQPEKETPAAASVGHKVDFNDVGPIASRGRGRPRRSAAAYTNSPSVKGQSSESSDGKNKKDGLSGQTDRSIQDGQVAGPSSILKKTLPNSNLNDDNNLPSNPNPNSVNKPTKTVTIADEKEEQTQKQNEEEEAAVKTEMDDFKNFFENSYKVKLGQLKNSWMEEDRETFKKAYNVNDQGFEEMRSEINLSLLTMPEEFLMDSPIMSMGSMPVLCGPIPTPGSKKLASLAMLKFANIGRGLGDFFWKSPIVLDQMTMDQQVTDRKLRTRDNKLRQAEEMAKPVEFRNSDLVDMDDFIMTIRVYQNFKNDDIIADQLNLNLEPKFLYEIQVLASQTVTELRKMLTCENDHVCVKSFEHPSQYNPSHPDESIFAKNCFTGSIICIGNKLYMDMENANSVEMANSVIDWGKANEDKKLGPFEKASSSDTKIKDLVIRFGYPYVFIHLGNCEHLMVFTTSKLITYEDRLERSIYPRRSDIGKLRIINCNVDNENMAKWAVIGCDRFPSSQMMICEDCLLTYCYNAEGKKIGVFKLFPIINIAGKL